MPYNNKRVTNNAARSKPLNKSRMAAMEKQYGKEKAKKVYEEMEKKPKISLKPKRKK
jgi:hypothetical protein